MAEITFGNKPYYEKGETRTFYPDTDDKEFVWHRDLEDRRITVLEGSGWYYQKEDELPIELSPGVDIFIRALEWHRVIKGTNTLKIKIQS